MQVTLVNSLCLRSFTTHVWSWVTNYYMYLKGERCSVHIDSGSLTQPSLKVLPKTWHTGLLNWVTS